MSVRMIVAAMCGVFLLIAAFMVMGINHNGYRTVVQRPSGYTFVKFTPGPYLLLFGQQETYPDIITFDFDEHHGGADSRSIQQDGIPVRYQDGGNGTIYGQARYVLPNDEPTMLALHRAFRSTEGTAYKLIKPTTEQTMNLTAGLMTSEESYNTKRGVFIEWAREQLEHGRYKTVLQTKETKEEGTENTVYKDFPVIENGKDGRPIFLDDDFRAYGITLSGFQVTKPDFEPKTLEQIAAKRAATMAIITAKANAERAKQDAITAEQEGLRNIAVAKYEKGVDKEKAIVEAEQSKVVAETRAAQDKQVAEIGAQQLVAVATQGKLEAEQKKLAAGEYKQEQTMRGEGDAAYKKAVIEADGALAQKLATYERVMGNFATHFGQQRWVPEIEMGASGAPGNQAQNLIDLLTTKAAKDLSLDLGVSTRSQAK